MLILKQLKGQTYREEIDGDAGGVADGGGSGDGGGGDSSAAGSDAGAGTGLKPAGDGGSPPVNYFSGSPENWRSDFAAAAGFEGEDATKRAGQLERVTDLGAIAKTYFSAQDRIRKGEISTGLPDNPSESQMTEYREAHGTPVTADAYTVDLSEGLVLGEADGRIMEGIYPIAHKHNISSAAITEMTEAMLQGRQIEEQALMDQDGIHKQSTDKALRDAWESDFQANLNIVQGLVNQLPEDTRENFLNARMQDGRAVFNDPGFMVAMADWARKLNPSATVVPNANNPMQSINDEIATLEKQMGTPEWHKDKAAQARYMQLLDAKQQMGAA